MYRYGQEEVDAVVRVLKSGHWFRYGLGGGHLYSEADLFEKEWSEQMGNSFSCFTSSGTAALMCAYAGLGLGPGDEVIVPGYTWIASALAPLHMGVIPVLVDIDSSLTLDPESVELAITDRTRAICAVHMNGFVADLSRLKEIAVRHELKLIEDCCQCDGGYTTHGQRVGNIGDAGAFSFNFYKLISCGEGGMFVAPDEEVYDRGRIFHDAGFPFRSGGQTSVDVFAGINLRGNELMAALIRVQLSRLDGIVDDLLRNRGRVARFLDDEIGGVRYVGNLDTGTGSHLGLHFEDEGSAQNFLRSLKQKNDDFDVNAYRAIESGRHVYTNWESLLSKRGAHVDQADPFMHPLNSECPDYEKDMLPRTLDILRRTVLTEIDPEWSEGECYAVAERMRRAAKLT